MLCVSHVVKFVIPSVCRLCVSPVVKCGIPSVCMLCVSPVVKFVIRRVCSFHLQTRFLCVMDKLAFLNYSNIQKRFQLIL